MNKMILSSIFKTLVQQSDKTSVETVRSVETMIWAAVAIIPAVIFGKMYFYSPTKILDWYSQHPFWGMYTALALLMPLLSLIVFGGFPFELIRARRIAERNALVAVREMPGKGAGDAERRASLFRAMSSSEITAIEASQNLDPRELLAYYAFKSSNTAADIYRRSSIYLFVGVTIAASGLLFLYFRTVDLPNELDLLSRLVILAPTLGVLFFIEFVAFFFLRQHRVSMEEFRYFEQIKRNREENLLILKMYAENKSVVSTAEVLKAMAFYSSPPAIANGTTTEMLENRKLLKDETEIFERIINAATAFRNNERIKK
ncbi:hypothetical protein [Methylobacterium sp. CCH5-D2]|uniref:hypothetical protein n=1 Tax=Methylobacterium sp. CCH5-D2 TaxID=1768765 RepID=UPI0012E3634F|nr:hypothetical protein [Methylobacterium sp. CCH5-D2]